MPGTTSVLRYFGKSENDGGVLCCFLSEVSRAIVEGRPIPQGAEELTTQSCKEKLLHILDDELRNLKVNAGMKEIEGQRLEAKIAASNVPSVERCDQLLRYETAIERQFYRASHELERRQRSRMGMAVPSPVMLDVEISEQQD